MKGAWLLWRHLPRVAPYLRPYWKLAAIAVVLTLLSSVLTLAAPWPLALLVDNVLGKRKLPSLLAELGIQGHPTHLLILAALFSFGLAIAGNAMTVVNNYVESKVRQFMVLDLRSDLFEHCQKLSFAFHDQRRTGELMARINYTAASIGTIVMSLPPLAQSAVTLTGMFCIAFAIDYQIALVSLVVLPFLYYSLGLYGTKIVPRLQHVQKLEWQSLSIVNEAMSMLRVIVSFGRERYEHQRFRSQGETAVDARINLTVRQTVFSLGVNSVTAAGTALIFGLGGLKALHGQLSVGQLLVLLSYIAAVYKPLESISTTVGSINEQLVQLKGSLDLLDVAPEVSDAADAKRVTRVRGRVVFDRVGFSYAGRENTLSDISFEAQPGERVAVVGPTGAGKTTLLSLLVRFYDPQHGVIAIDGIDIKQIKLVSLRDQISVVLQEPLLFSGTITDNIRYGRLDATDEEIVTAAKQANAHDFIEQLPGGYQTQLGERGAQLSGGERQRICIARAFIKDAPILVLDEPTSSIDSKTEAVILDALDKLMLGRTSFMVAHRLSTIRDADKILVIDGGRKVEEGSHADLLTRRGLYYQLHLAQTTSRAYSDENPAGSSGGAGIIGGAGSIVAGGGSGRAGGSVGGAGSTGGDGTKGGAGSVGEFSVTSRKKQSVFASNGSRSAAIVVLGMMTKIPVAGVVWQTVHYLIGLKRLGFDVYYVETHARTPSMLMRSDSDDSGRLAADFIANVMKRFDLGHNWAYVALHDRGQHYGLSEMSLHDLYGRAELLLNLHGGTRPLPEQVSTERLVYLETDPVQPQIELHKGNEQTWDFLRQHCAFFTFAENYGKPSCLLPVCSEFEFVPTRQPVVLDFWNEQGLGEGERLSSKNGDGIGETRGESFTTIGNWRQSWRELEYEGETYRWSKHHEFLKFLELPQRTGQEFELALAGCVDRDKALLESHGWRVIDALEVSSDVDRYRNYIASSRGEFTVAKDQNVRLRTGWFSDRSASYLASGRPVVTQDTGFGEVIGTGEGCFAFSNLEQAASAVEAITAQPERHRRAAYEIAREFFCHERVLKPLLDHVGVSVSRRSHEIGSHRPAFPLSLRLTPRSRRPLELDAGVSHQILGADIDRLRAFAQLPDSRAQASIIIPTHNQLGFTKLCLESLFAYTDAPAYEVIVVDNASHDQTVDYLNQLRAILPQLRVIENSTNRGFPAAINQGVAIAQGNCIVILNNDTIVTPGWLSALIGHLDEEVGVVCPTTNRSGTEADIEVEYDTYGELLSFAAARVSDHAGATFEIGMPAMFCVALARSTYDRVGPLDEGFGLGLYEDDDYAVRVRQLGLKTVCAEDVFVHHFGEATFGHLFASGERDEIRVSNQKRFTSKWGHGSEHGRRNSGAYNDLVTAVKQLVDESIPSGSTVAVVTRGDDRLLNFASCTGWHFPRGDQGVYAGFYPATSSDAIAHLEQLREQGMDYLVIPRPYFWWSDYYTEFASHLDYHYESVGDGVESERCAVIYKVHERVERLAVESGAFGGVQADESAKSA